MAFCYLFGIFFIFERKPYDIRHFIVFFKQFTFMAAWQVFGQC